MDSEQLPWARLSPGCPETSTETQPRPVPTERLPWGGDTRQCACDNCSGASGSGAGRVTCFWLDSRALKGEVSRADTQGKSASARHSGRTHRPRQGSTLSERTPWTLLWWGGDGEGEGGKGALRWPGARSQKDPLIPQLPAFGNHLENFKKLWVPP